MRTHDEIIARALERYKSGRQCAEAVFLALGEARVPDFDSKLVRVATGFGGGIAESADVCGALVGGVMIIGLMHGRTHLHDDHTRAWAMSRAFRTKFLDELGSTSCSHLTHGNFSWDSHTKCEDVVTSATRLFLEVIDHGNNHGNNHFNHTTRWP